MGGVEWLNGRWFIATAASAIDLKDVGTEKGVEPDFATDFDGESRERENSVRVAILVGGSICRWTWRKREIGAFSEELMGQVNVNWKQLER